GPQIEDRCKSLRQVLSPIGSPLEVLDRMPQLLTFDSAVFHRSAAIVEGYLGTKMGRDALRSRLVFLVQVSELSHLFAKVKERFAEDFIRARLQERTSGEWPRWPLLAGKSDGDILTWIGRISIEEREADCKTRVHSFGAAPFGAAALAAPELAAILGSFADSD
ncbi:unnamed protein product, partial [Polarella glacialis]